MSLELGKFEVQMETGWMELVTGKFSAPQDSSHLCVLPLWESDVFPQSPR